jgi:hypothetical protein
MTRRHDHDAERDPSLAVPSRRNFLVGGAAVVAGVSVVGAMGPQFAGAATKSMLPAATGGGGKAKGSSAPSAKNDLKIAALAAGLEVLAVGTYKAALDAATMGKLGAVPDAGATYVQTALAQHQAQLDAWNGVITGAGGTAVTKPNAKLKKVVDKRFAAVKDFGGAAMLARDLEGIAASTYLAAIPKLSSADAITLAGSIQIVDMQHAAILNYVLGEYPVPDVFAKTDQAVAA